MPGIRWECPACQWTNLIEHPYQPDAWRCSGCGQIAEWVVTNPETPPEEGTSDAKTI